MDVCCRSEACSVPVKNFTEKYTQIFTVILEFVAKDESQRLSYLFTNHPSVNYKVFWWCHLKRLYDEMFLHQMQYFCCGLAFLLHDNAMLLPLKLGSTF